MHQTNNSIDDLNDMLVLNFMHQTDNLIDDLNDMLVFNFYAPN
jgi:hypothetical protein